MCNVKMWVGACACSRVGRPTAVTVSAAPASKLPVCMFLKYKPILINYEISTFVKIRLPASFGIVQKGNGHPLTNIKSSSYILFISIYYVPKEGNENLFFIHQIVYMRGANVLIKIPIKNTF